jgi:hypothetical protein
VPVLAKAVGVALDQGERTTKWPGGQAPRLQRFAQPQRVRVARLRAHTRAVAPIELAVEARCAVVLRGAPSLEPERLQAQRVFRGEVREELPRGGA